MWIPWGSVLFMVTVSGSLCRAVQIPRERGRSRKDSSNVTVGSNSTVSGSSPYRHPKPDDIQVGCKELRAKRYLSDGYCTSIKPIREVVCAGQCLPLKEQNLPWWAEFVKYWSRTKLKEYRCTEDIVRRRKVRLLCENGETRTYKIKIVKSCKCKQYKRPHNDSQTIRDRRRDKNRKNRKRKQRKKAKDRKKDKDNEKSRQKNTNRSKV